MIKFYASKDCRECAKIREEMSQISLAHEVVFVEDRGLLQTQDGVISALPAIIEGKTIVQGLENVQRYFKDLRRFKSQWDRFQSDSCYCGPDGDIE